MARIADYSLEFVREPLRDPFGFKGGSLSELWQVICRIDLDNGCSGMGVGVQSVLWSDARVFGQHTQAGGNALMFCVTEYALRALCGREFTDPPALQKAIWDVVYDYAAKVVQKERPSDTFVLNAMVAVDFALWQIWGRLRQTGSFDALCEAFCPALRERQSRLGEIPLISYQVPEADIKKLLEEGAFILKIKIGADPDGANDPEAMCRWDIERVKRIHEMADSYDTKFTSCGHPVYYLDANGRYPDKALLRKFLQGVEACGALPRIVLLEEPFPESNLQDVSDLPVRVVGDESAHSAESAAWLIDRYHYGAIALKPIAKTLSATLGIYQMAHARGIPCFCADLTVPPAMLEWNMQMAARIPAVPGLKTGILESNGPQNYRNWSALLGMHPLPRAGWLHPKRHIFELDEAFYTANAPFAGLPEYEKILEKGGGN